MNEMGIVCVAMLNETKQGACLGILSCCRPERKTCVHWSRGDMSTICAQQKTANTVHDTRWFSLTCFVCCEGQPFFYLGQRNRALCLLCSVLTLFLVWLSACVTQSRNWITLFWCIVRWNDEVFVCPSMVRHKKKTTGYRPKTKMDTEKAVGTKQSSDWKKWNPVGDKLNSQVETTCLFSLLANLMSMNEIGAPEGCEVTKGTIRYMLWNVHSILVSYLFERI